MLISLPTIYHACIEKIMSFTGIPDSLLHIHAGLAILLIARFVSQKRLSTFVPLAFVFVAESANEIMDWLYFGSWRPADTISDVINTLLWPTMLCIMCRLQPLPPQLTKAAITVG